MAILPPTNPAIPRCPRCRAKAVIKKGTRTTRHEARQRWGCTRCGHTFINKALKCAYFDERDYFEFYPLPAIYPRRSARLGA
jgi:hypothetical protein